MRPRNDQRRISYITQVGKKITVTPPRDILRMYRIATYCRVSTLRDAQSESLQAQVEYYRNYVRRRRDWILVGEYADVKSARSVHARDQFNQMIADCMAGNIDIIVTKSVSRFGRNTIDTLTVLRQLKDKDVDVFFESENLHSLDGDSEFLLTLMEAIAQNESEERSRNIKWGIHKQARNPNAPIYSRPCYGYRKADDGTLVVHEDEAKIIRLIYELYLSGYSIIAITRELERRQVTTSTGKEKWSKRALETILSNEKYIGDSLVYKTYCDEYPSRKRIVNQGTQDQFYVEDHHEAIISKEQFEEVQAEKSRRTNIEKDSDGNRVRKKTHHSTKAALNDGGNSADHSRRAENGDV